MRKIAELINEGDRVNRNIAKYLKMEAWTPVIGALVVCGVKAPANCKEIPLGGVGLDNLKLHPSSTRFHQARDILANWNDWNEGNNPPRHQLTPVEFILWCDDEEIENEWLRLIRKNSGITISTRVDLTLSHVALLDTSSTTTPTGVERNSRAVFDTPPGKIPRIAIGKLAVRAAWEIECKDGRKATPNQVIKMLQAWTIAGEEDVLCEVTKTGVTWTPKRKDKPKSYDLEACEKALATWHQSRA